MLCMDDDCMGRLFTFHFFIFVCVCVSVCVYMSVCMCVCVSVCLSVCVIFRFLFPPFPHSSLFRALSRDKMEAARLIESEIF